MITTFGAPSAGVGRGGHHDCDAAIVRPIVPWNPA